MSAICMSTYFRVHISKVSDTSVLGLKKVRNLAQDRLGGGGGGGEIKWMEFSKIYQLRIMSIIMKIKKIL